MGSRTARGRGGVFLVLPLGAELQGPPAPRAKVPPSPILSYLGFLSWPQGALGQAVEEPRVGLLLPSGAHRKDGHRESRGRAPTWECGWRPFGELRCGTLTAGVQQRGRG